MGKYLAVDRRVFVEKLVVSHPPSLGDRRNLIQIVTVRMMIPKGITDTDHHPGYLPDLTRIVSEDDLEVKPAHLTGR